VSQQDEPLYGEIKPCPYCGATGEGYEIGLQGDGWTGGPCWNCNGWGTVVKIGIATYRRTGKYGQVFRDANGRFFNIRLLSEVQRDAA
jgi:hypothetical protein